MSSLRSLAVGTAFYPGVEPFLQAWYQSIQHQTDQNFQLWIALDALDVRTAIDAMGGNPVATWILVPSGDTPAQVRQRLLERLVETCDGIVLVDSDDVLHPNRVAAARSALQRSDLVGCTLRLVDVQGRDSGLTLGLPKNVGPDEILPRHNVYGLSNTAWRADLMSQCLPIPETVEIVDWFLATKAWLCGAKLSFDADIGMDYRQHGSNMAQVRAPFTREQVVRDTERVLQHYRLVRAFQPRGAIPARTVQIDEVMHDVERFRSVVLGNENLLVQYLEALNALDPAPLWWSSVAHPSLRHFWTQERETS